MGDTCSDDGLSSVSAAFDQAYCLCSDTTSHLGGNTLEFSLNLTALNLGLGSLGLENTSLTTTSESGTVDLGSFANLTTASCVDFENFEGHSADDMIDPCDVYGEYQDEHLRVCLIIIVYIFFILIPISSYSLLRSHMRMMVIALNILSLSLSLSLCIYICAYVCIYS